MHELPMAQSMLEIVLDHASQAGAGRITDVHIVVGELSGIEPECIEFYWETLSLGTAAAGSRLHFRRTAFVLRCLDCEEEFPPDGESYVCPVCASRRVRVSGGDEMRVEAIDVEDVSGSAAAARPAMGGA